MNAQAPRGVPRGERSLRVGIGRESYPGEARVALVPSVIPRLAQAGCSLLVEAGAGERSGFPDESYRATGALVVGRTEALDAEVVLQVRTPGANPDAGRADLSLLHGGQVLVGLADALSNPESAADVAARGATLFALELIPRITRAQAMDVLSSQAIVVGYRAVLMAASALPKLFPLLTTAAGTITPARILVIGAGVAGLQAIATARRLGAVVEAYDVRPAVREEVESLGARFVELPLAPGDAADASGYAKALGEQFYARQQELLGKVVAESDVVLTTAGIPGARAPRLITRDMVAAMAPGSVIVDLTAERGGNCELTEPDRVVEAFGVTVFGPTNLPASAPRDASQLYARNVTAFLLSLVDGGRIRLDLEDEIVRGSLVAHGGRVVHPKVRMALGLAPLTPDQPREVA